MALAASSQAQQLASGVCAKSNVVNCGLSTQYGAQLGSVIGSKVNLAECGQKPSIEHAVQICRVGM